MFVVSNGESCYCTKIWFSKTEGLYAQVVLVALTLCPLCGVDQHFSL